MDNMGQAESVSETVCRRRQQSRCWECVAQTRVDVARSCVRPDLCALAVMAVWEMMGIAQDTSQRRLMASWKEVIW